MSRDADDDDAEYELAWWLTALAATLLMGAVLGAALAARDFAREAAQTAGDAR